MTSELGPYGYQFEYCSLVDLVGNSLTNKMAFFIMKSESIISVRKITNITLCQ